MCRRPSQWMRGSRLAVMLVAFQRIAVVQAAGHDDTNRLVSQELTGRADHKPESVLFVDRDLGRLDGACTNNDPCARITDALTIARAMRYGLDPSIPVVGAHQRIKIKVRASASPYLASSDPARLAANPDLEKLPLFINISDLDLVGESKFKRDEDGWIEKDAAITGATVIKTETPLPGNLELVLIGVSQGMAADDVTIKGFVLDGNAAPGSGGFLIVVDRGQRFAVRDMFETNATYGVATQGASGVVDRCLMTNLGEGVLVFGGNSTDWTSDVTVRNTRSTANIFGGLVFFGSPNVINGMFPVANFGAYQGVFQPVLFTGTIDKTVGHVIHNDLSNNAASPTLITSGLRMAPIGPNLPMGQSAGHLVMTVSDNRLNDNDHGVVLDAGFPFRSRSTDFSGSFTGHFSNNEVTGSHTAKALITFTRNQATEFPTALATWKYLVDSRYQVIYASGEFDDGPGASGFVWIDNPLVDAGDASRILHNELILERESRDDQHP